MKAYQPLCAGKVPWKFFFPFPLYFVFYKQIQGSNAARKTPAEKENPIVAKTRIVLSPPPVIVSFYYTKYSCL